MNVYIKHRFLLLLPVLLGITFFTFVLMQLPADDTVDMMYKASGAVSETVKAAARAELGLDRPAAGTLSGLAAGCLQRRYGTFVYFRHACNSAFCD